MHAKIYDDHHLCLTHSISYVKDFKEKLVDSWVLEERIMVVSRERQLIFLAAFNDWSESLMSW